MHCVDDSGELRGPAKLLAFVFQHPVIKRPQLRVAKNALGTNNLHEPPRRIWIAGIVVGVVGLDGPAEGVFERSGIVIRTSAENVVKMSSA